MEYEKAARSYENPMKPFLVMNKEGRDALTQVPKTMVESYGKNGRTLPSSDFTFSPF